MDKDSQGEEISYKESSHDIQRISEEEISIDGARFRLAKNYKDAFDLDLFKGRYTDYFEKFDYIVGDMAYELLRLRGFYQTDTPKVPLDMEISHLQDYIDEYCNFDAAYFVLERLDEKTVFPDYSNQQKGRPRKNKQKQRGQQKQKTKGHRQKLKKKKPKNTEKAPQSNRRKQTKKRNFQIRKKDQ